MRWRALILARFSLFDVVQKIWAHRAQEGMAATIRMGHSILPVCRGGESTEGLFWKLIGSGTWEEYDQAVLKDDGTEADTCAVIVDDTLAMMASSAGGCCDWILSPFVSDVSAYGSK